MSSLLPLHLALAVALASGDPVRAVTVVAVGDSITWGVTRSGTRDRGPGQRDSQGGYPGRLAIELGGAARVLNRGLGGSTAEGWLRRAPRDASIRGSIEAVWPDFHPARDPEPGESILSYVLAGDRPDLVLVLIGINDVWRARGTDLSAAAIAKRIARVARTVRRAGAAVIVGTLLPNRRDPPDTVAAINERLCEIEPDCVRLDRAFAAGGGTALLGDEIHPNEQGHALIARVLAQAVRSRGLLGQERLRPRRARPGSL